MPLPRVNYCAEGCTLQEILNQLKTGQLAKVYVVHGPEQAWHDLIYQALYARIASGGLGEWNWSVYSGHKDFSIAEFLNDAATLPWGGGEKLVVLKDAQLVPGEELERLARWLQGHEPAGSLALFFDKLDNRLRYVKLLLASGQEIFCRTLEGEELARHIAAYCHARGKSIDRRACEQFMDMVGTDLHLIHNELDKLISYAGGQQKITADMVREVTSLAPGEAAQNAVFAMGEHIAAGDQKAALAALEDLLSAGESPFRILPLIERQLRLLLAAKMRVGTFEDTAELMGEKSAYPLRKAAQHANRFSVEQLCQGFSAVLDADREMKLGSSGEAVLRDLVVRLTLLPKTR